MVRGMTTTKIAVSLPSGLVQRARHAVRSGRSPSVRAYIALAVQEKTTLEDLAALLREMLAETGGPLTAADRRQADETLGWEGPRHDGAVERPDPGCWSIDRFRAERSPHRRHPRSGSRAGH
jgi:hypothetical protein